MVMEQSQSGFYIESTYSVFYGAFHRTKTPCFCHSLENTDSQQRHVNARLITITSQSMPCRGKKHGAVFGK
jgi:hypothetical protein